MARSLIGKIRSDLASGNPPVPFAMDGHRQMVFGGRNRGDNSSYMRTYAQAGTVFSIVQLLGQSTGAPQWNLYRKAPQDGRVRYTTADRGTDNRVQVVQHAALSVWRKPNYFHTQTELTEAGQQHFELTGNWYWVLQREGGLNFPTSIWNVRPDRMEPVPSAKNFLNGYIYSAPNGEKIPLGIDEVIHIKSPNPLDPYEGIGPVQALLVDIDGMKYSAEWNRNFFLNSATPGGIIKVPKRLTDSQWTEFSDRWRESHQGVSRAHRVAMLEGTDWDWIDASVNARDMQFVEMRAVSRDVIREAWRLHKSMLGNADDVNRANAQTAEEVFGRWHIRPRLDRIREILNEKFLPMFYPRGTEVPVEFDYVNPLPDDREADNAELTAKTNAWSVLVTAGADPDDAAEVVGLPPMAMSAPKPAASSVAPPDGTGELEQAGESTGEPAEDDSEQDHGFENEFLSVLQDYWKEFRPNGKELERV